MTGKIYLLQDNGSLQAMSERSYVTEERLQLLLKDYPDLLAGDQMDEQNPRRWLLISHEVGVSRSRKAAATGCRWTTGAPASHRRRSRMKRSWSSSSQHSSGSLGR
jgi:hypothetical protein